MYVKAHVTQKLIDEGLPGSCSLCPVALAIHQVVPHPHVEVGASTITLSDERGKDLYVDMPDVVYDFTLRFDSHKKVEPFSFTLYY